MLSNTFIHLKPFKITRETLEVIDTELNKGIGICNMVNNHNIAIDFMLNLKLDAQKKINKKLNRKEI